MMEYNAHEEFVAYRIHRMFYYQLPYHDLPVATTFDAYRDAFPEIFAEEYEMWREWYFDL